MAHASDASFAMGALLEALPTTGATTQRARLLLITANSSPAELLRAAALDDTDADDRAAAAKLLAVATIGEIEQGEMVRGRARARTCKHDN